MKRIPLDTKFHYYCSAEGKIFKGEVELKGWKHESSRRKGVFGHGNGKSYLRFGLWMKDGRRKFFFAQRLVGLTYLNLAETPNKIMRHLTEDTFCNTIHSLAVGTHEENQTIDRIEQGTYMNRGGGASNNNDLQTNNDPLPF